MNKALSRLQLSLNAAVSEANSPSEVLFLSVSLTLCVLAPGKKRCVWMTTPARGRGGAHPRFQPALNVSDAPLGMTLGLGEKHTNTHTHTHAGSHRLLIKTCCISILLRFYVASEKCFDLWNKRRQKSGEGSDHVHQTPGLTL